MNESRGTSRRSFLLRGAGAAAAVAVPAGVASSVGAQESEDLYPPAATSLGVVEGVAGQEVTVRHQAGSREVEGDVGALVEAHGPGVQAQSGNSTETAHDDIQSWEVGHRVVFVEALEGGNWVTDHIERLYEYVEPVAVAATSDSTIETAEGDELVASEETRIRPNSDGAEAVPFSEIEAGDDIVAVGYADDGKTALVDLATYPD